MVKNPPITAVPVDEIGKVQGILLRVIELDPLGMTLYVEENCGDLESESVFEITIFGTLSFRVRGKLLERTNSQEVRVKFTKIDPESKRILEETFGKFSRLKGGKFNPAEASLGKAGRKRIPVRLPATILVGEVMIGGLIENLSEGGAFFACDRLLPLEAEGILRFTPDATLPLLTLQAKVVWHWQEMRHGARTYPAGAGLQFLGGTAESLRILKEYLKEKIQV